MKFMSCPHCGGTNLKVMTEEKFEQFFSGAKSGCVSIECKDCNTEMYVHSVFRNADTDSEEYRIKAKYGWNPLPNYEEGIKALARKWNTRALVNDDYYEI